MACDTARLRLLAEAARPTLDEIRRDYDDAPPLVARMLRYLEDKLFEPSLNVTTWRKALGIRDKAISIEFHAAIGEPPKQYITRHRIATAARLLCTTRLQVWQVGELVGYSSLGVFSKAFNRTTGLRPIQYRRRHREPETPRSTVFRAPEQEAAVAGTLPTPRAAELIEAIFSVYPSLSVQW